MFKTDGILFVSLLRLAFIPFALTSYFLGVTSVSVFDYMVGTIIFIIQIMLAVLMGCCIWQGTENAQDESGNQSYIAILIFEVVLILAFSIVVTVWAAHEFNQRVEAMEFQKEIRKEFDEQDE